MGISGHKAIYLGDKEIHSVFMGNTLVYSKNESSDVVSEPEYISDGLVLLYDGIKNTDDGHSTSSTEWKDLSGNGQDANIIGNTYLWEDNALYFQDGNYASFSATKDYALPMTVEIVINPIKSSGYARTFSLNDDAYSLQGGSQAGRAYFGKKIFDIDNSSGHGFGADIIRSYTCVAEANGSCKFYKNGELIVSGNVSQVISPAISSEEKNFLNNQGSTALTVNRQSIKIHSFRIYDKVLSDEEIQQNHAKDKTRFGF